VGIKRLGVGEREELGVGRVFVYIRFMRSRIYFLDIIESGECGMVVWNMYHDIQAL
jgi:hypothetical protein